MIINKFNYLIINFAKPKTTTMKTIILTIALLTFNTIYSQQDSYKIVVDGKEVWLSAKTGEQVANKSVNHNYRTANNSSIYKAISGDTYYAIAKKNGISIEKLYELNSINQNNILSIGTSLFVTDNTAYVTSINTQVSTNSEFHTVTKGDTLYNISKRYHTTVENLLLINSLTSNAINIDQRLKIK